MLQDIKNNLSIKMTRPKVFGIKKTIYSIETTKGLFVFYNIIDLSVFIKKQFGVNL